MKNQLGYKLRESHRKGVEDGIVTGQLLMLIALENIADEFVPEDRIDEFLQTAESEIGSVWKGTKEMMREEQKLNARNMVDINALTVSDYLIGHSERIRAKRHMDEVWKKEEGFYVCPYCGNAEHEKSPYCRECGKGLGNG